MIHVFPLTEPPPLICACQDCGLSNSAIRFLTLNHCSTDIEKALQGELGFQDVEQAIASCKAAAAELRGKGFDEEANSITEFLESLEVVPDAETTPHDDGLSSADTWPTLAVECVSDVGERRLFGGVAEVEGTTDRDDEIDAKAQQMESESKTQAQAHGEQEALREKDAEFLFQGEADATRQSKLNHVLKSRVDFYQTRMMVNRVEMEMQQENASAQGQKIWSKILQRHKRQYEKAVKHRDALISSGGCLLVERPRNAASSGQYSFMHCASDALYNSGLVLGLKGNGNWRQDLGKVRKDVQKAKGTRERQGGVKTEDPQWSDLAMVAAQHGMEIVNHFSSTLTGDQMRQADFFELPQGVYMARLTLTRHAEQGVAKARQKKHRRKEHHMIVLDAQDLDSKGVLDNDPTKEKLQFTHEKLQFTHDSRDCTLRLRTTGLRYHSSEINLLLAHR